MKQTTTGNRDNQYYQRKVNRSDNFLAALNLTSDEDSWLLDSGATNHVCRNKDRFVDLREVSSDPIMTASGTTEAKGYGHIFLQTSIHNESIEIKLNNVLYVPNVRRNLLSVSKIEENGNRVTFRNMVARVFNPENRIIAEVTNANAMKLAINGNILKEKAILLALKMGQDNFEASNGWLEKFKARRNIAFKRLHGEAGSVDANSVATWKGFVMDEAMEEVVEEEMNRCFEALKKHQAIDVNYIDFLEVDKDVQVAGEQSIE
ncbi:PDC2 [Cordylochernes scorpioides]|uniref:PDC2 n=1 Tax=Cordylochernes scorpioides TaxID=51811 RepID=A0ABY6KED7_9ARAC|nr:PDC2 [Cordylochernes scorpioides]